MLIDVNTIKCSCTVVLTLTVTFYCTLHTFFVTEKKKLVVIAQIFFVCNQRQLFFRQVCVCLFFRPLSICHNVGSRHVWPPCLDNAVVPPASRSQGQSEGNLQPKCKNVLYEHNIGAPHGSTSI